MNELFIDTGARPGYPKKAFVFMREKPFENNVQKLSSPWFTLPTWNVDATLVQSANLTAGGNRVNHVQLVGDLAASGAPTFFGAYKPRVNLRSIGQHGLHRIEEHTRFFDIEGTAFATTHANWLQLVISWNALNHRYWTGMINLGEMRVEIRPGQKIAIFNGPLGGYEAFPADSGVPYLGFGTGVDLLTFYVEGVQHQWTAGPQPMATTNLLVSHGYVEGFRTLDLAKEIVTNWQDLQFTGQEAPLTGLPSLNFLPAASLIEIAEVDAAAPLGSFNPTDHTTETK
jgi:hypothetical protein